MFAVRHKKQFKLPVYYSKLSIVEKKQIRELYTQKQQGKCYFCHKDLNKLPSRKMLGMPINKKLFPKNFFDYPIHLHHNHSTDLTIGAVHNLCNAVLFQYCGE